MGELLIEEVELKQETIIAYGKITGNRANRLQVGI